MDGYYSRIEGIVLIIVGALFYFLLLRREHSRKTTEKKTWSWADCLFLLASMTVLLLTSNLTVRFGVLLADSLHINPVLVAMLFVGVGTTLPELFFSIKAVRKNHASLAMGDILGTVITDAVIIVGILAMIKPFVFNQRIVYVTGIFMVLRRLFCCILCAPAEF